MTLPQLRGRLASARAALAYYRTERDLAQERYDAMAVEVSAIEAAVINAEADGGDA